MLPNIDYWLILRYQARELFLEGVELERSGQHFSAIQKYKRAVQLVPDIEYRTFEFMRRNNVQGGGLGKSCSATSVK